MPTIQSPHHDLIMAEELLLLALDSDTGQPYAASELVLNISLASLTLSELALRERLVLEDERAVLTDDASLGHPVLDHVLRVIRLSRRDSAARWIAGFARGDLRQRLLDELVRRDVLRRDEERSLFIFRTQRHYLRDAALVERLLAPIDEVLLHGGDPDLRTLTLLPAINSSQLIPALYRPEEQAIAKARYEGMFVKKRQRDDG